MAADMKRGRPEAAAEEQDYTTVSVRMTRDEAAKLGVLAREHSRTKSAEAAYAIRLYFQAEAKTSKSAGRRAAK